LVHPVEEGEDEKGKAEFQFSEESEKDKPQQNFK
jgi:hypothetical protein